MEPTGKMEESTLTRRHNDVFAALLPLLFMAVYYYGMRALALSVAAMLTAWMTDLVCVAMRRTKYPWRDLSAPAIGLSLALMMPASVSYHVLLFTCVFAVAVVRQAFGGRTSHVFSPAAAGFAFANVCWPGDFALFPTPFATLPLWGKVPVETLSSSFERMLATGSIPRSLDFDLLLGRFLGPMGGTHVLVLLICAVTLLARRTLSMTVTLTSLSTMILLAYRFPRIGVSGLQSVTYELISGIFLFAVIFLASDPCTIPGTRTGRFWYGVCFGLLVMMFRHFGATAGSSAFALIIVNALSDLFDSGTLRLFSRIRARVSRFEKERAGEIQTEQEQGGEA